MDNYKDDLKHIRSMMERSSTFLSLSGLSGIFAGIVALIGAFVVYSMLVSHGIDYFDGKPNFYPYDLLIKLIVVCFIILALAMACGVWFTVQKSKKNNLPLWSSTTKQLLIQLAIPLIIGGKLCLIFTYHHSFYYVAPSMLIFYGLALINASKYTLPEVFWLGICETILGLMAAMWIGYGLIFWAIGFGVLHIIYGTLMYRKYDAK